MIKKIILILIFLITSFSFSQINQDEIEKISIKNGFYLLNILDQKLLNNNYITTKQKQYVARVLNNKIINQKIYNILNGNITDAIEIEYAYSDNTFHNLKKMTYKDFKGNLIKEIVFNYDSEGLLVSKIEYDTLGEYDSKEIERTAYDYLDCKPEFINDLLDDFNSEHPNRVFYCLNITTFKKTKPNLSTQVEVYNIGTGKVKEIYLNGDKNAKINKFYTYDYKDNISQIYLHQNDTIKLYKTLIENKFGDVITLIQGDVALDYTYKYDKNKHWIKKVETSKDKNKRRVFIRSFTYY
ncbi:MAG TPA: hypothetical protein ENK67_01565 [Flavobacteriia bacterium]|nr:hypothetical protein [Flavobacteriia bacterium]